jgi:hypothetical protein
MDIVHMAMFANGEAKPDAKFEVTMVNNEKFVGPIKILNSGKYMINDGRKVFFTADKVVYLYAI